MTRDIIYGGFDYSNRLLLRPDQQGELGMYWRFCWSYHCQLPASQPEWLVFQVGARIYAERKSMASAWPDCVCLHIIIQTNKVTERRSWHAPPNVLLSFSFSFFFSLVRISRLHLSIYIRKENGQWQKIHSVGRLYDWIDVKEQEARHHERGASRAWRNKPHKSV